MRVTKVNGHNIWDYCLKLRSYSGPYDLPARKKTTTDWNFGENDIMYEDKKLKFEFVGVYSSRLSLGAYIKAFTDMVASTIEGTIETDPGDQLNRPNEVYVGRFVNGVQVRIEGLAAFVTLVITWQGKTVK